MAITAEEISCRRFFRQWDQPSKKISIETVDARCIGCKNSCFCGTRRGALAEANR